MTRVWSIFTRLGPGGGGKVRAIQARANALAGAPGLEPAFLVLTHSLNQKIAFADLVAAGRIDPRIRCLSLAEAAAEGLPPLPEPPPPLPEGEPACLRGTRRVWRAGRAVLADERRVATAAGGARILRRFEAGRPVLTEHRLDGALVSRLEESGTVATQTLFAAGRAVALIRQEEGHFVSGRNLLDGRLLHGRAAFERSLLDLCAGGVLCLDGVTHAHLARGRSGPRLLFLHADHRGPDGAPNPRARALVEGFDGAAIVTATAAQARALAAELAPGAPVRVLPHAVAASAARPGPHPGPRPGPRPGPHPGPRRDLVTVSRLDLAAKPIGEAIRAFRKIAAGFPDCAYLIHGSGSGEARLAALIERLGLAGRVRLMGYAPDPRVVFAGALASVYPTRGEGFGLSILESLAEGCPVVSHDVDYGPREMIRPGENGELCPPGDIPALAAALARVLAAPAAYSAGCARTLGRYAPDACRARLRALVAEAAGGA